MDNNRKHTEENNLGLSYWRFRTFSPCNFPGWGNFTERFSVVSGPIFTKLGEDMGDHRRWSNLFSDFRYIAAFL